MSSPQRYVVCYDTPDDRQRRRLARLLSRGGARVQRSVFELLLDPPALRRLTRLLQRALTPEDRLLLYEAPGARFALGHEQPPLLRPPTSLI